MVFFDFSATAVEPSAGTADDLFAMLLDEVLRSISSIVDQSTDHLIADHGVHDVLTGRCGADALVFHHFAVGIKCADEIVELVREHFDSLFLGQIKDLVGNDATHGFSELLGHHVFDGRGKDACLH